ncbi:ABA4-like family protein [Variovorax sp. VaC1]|uniref:ABA4-like family protein n=1 Tax=Variovorax sp. VaC1 TaxID=3373132 RepID=UPI00374A1B1C
MFDSLFSAGSTVALPAWAALGAAPWLGRAKPAIWALTGIVIPVGLGLAYWWLMATYWSSAPGGGYGSLSAVHALFQQPALLTAGWFHYLAFDLFVGTWIAREGERAGIAPLLLLPCFVLTFLFGPVGLLAFLALRVAPWCAWLARELHRRQPQLAWFGGILLAAMVPALLAAWLDPRTLPGVGTGVWVKPLKFMASVSLYALTTAWLLGDLPRMHRGSRTERAIVAIVIATGLFEVAYITLQGALGQASHFNEDSTFHAVMFTLMGIGALSLTATALPLARLVARHGDTLAPAYRLAVVLGLVLTFVGGAGGGIAISLHHGSTIGAIAGGAVLPLVGWSATGGDLRVAHFLGVHAQQILPLAGALIAMLRLPFGRVAVWLAAGGYVALILLAFRLAYAGVPLMSFGA